MEAQKCKLCGARHHRYDPHIWPGDPKPQKAKPPPKAAVTPTQPKPRKEAVPHPRVPQQGGDNAPAPVKAGADPPKPAFDRAAYQKAYMRGYMKRWRAKHRYTTVG